MSATVDLSHESAFDSPLDAAEIQRVIDLVLSEEEVDIPCEVSVSLVDDDRIHELNREWRGIDRATDVLSFEMERPGEQEGEICSLGDVVLAPAYISHQAAEFGNTPGDEMRLLLIHGMLHLLGYDHVFEEDARVMESREDELLALAAGASATGGHVVRHGSEEGA